MTTGLRRVLVALVSSGDLSINACRRMLAGIPPLRPEPDEAGWLAILDDIRRSQEFRAGALARAERSIIDAAMLYLEAQTPVESRTALDYLTGHCRWLKAERENLAAEFGKAKA